MKIKVGVFFGGKSVEHEVSIISAIQAINSIDKNKYEVIPIYITKNSEMYVGEKIGDISAYRNIPALLKESTRVILINDGNKVILSRYPAKKFGNNTLDYIDVAFPIVHGTNVEDGALQGYLQTLGLPYVGCDVLSSAVGMDKYVMKTVFKDNDIPVLDCMIAHINDYAKDEEGVKARIKEKIGFPLIVKPVNLGSSVGIELARNEEELDEALDNAFTYASRLLIEHAITELKEINCSVCGDYATARASECEEPVNTDDILSFEDKYISGDKGGKSSGMATLKRKIPADIDEETREKIRTLAVKAFKCLGCSGVSRIDFMIDKSNGNIYLNEINTIPGSLSFYLWEPVGVKYPELLDEMISLALKREREIKALTFSFESNILDGFTGGKLGGAKGSKL
ncbi:MAG: D-alanine--D-alanine ligase [Ruminiclostridium sp.]|nr:D-alanine--D-alanine ligase [Ruminiclostridium sp.]